MNNMNNAMPGNDDDDEMEYFEEDETIITPAKSRKKGWGIIGGF
jgi:hypothetical protein